MAGALAMRLIGEAAEEELLRSVALHAAEVARKRAVVAQFGGPDAIAWIAIQAMKQSPTDRTEYIETHPDDPAVDFWAVSLVPNNGAELHTEDFDTFEAAEKRAIELSSASGRPIYTQST